MLEIELSVDDLKKAQAKMEQMAEDLAGPPMVSAVRDAILLVQRSAKLNASDYPRVDTGRLRASLVPEVVVRDTVIMGIVGSNVEYAAHMEYGTRPHWPPISAIQKWADRKGISAYLVARAIARHGTKPRRFLQRAVEENKHRIEQIFRAKAKIITDKES